MKLTHLIPMEDFVLQEYSKSAPIDNILQLMAECMQRCGRYAQFLKQKPELWMFVACDAEGKPITNDSKMVAIDNEKDMELYTAYHTAKQKCLFEGFEVVEDNKYFITVGSGTRQISFDKETPSVASKNDKEIKNISELCQINLSLTQTAIDKIYN